MGRRTMNEIVIEEALYLAENGMKLLPRYPSGAQCVPGKLTDVATSDADLIRSWHKEHECNFGVLTGVCSELVVVDLDLKNNDDVFDAYRRLIAEMRDGLDMPTTRVVITRNGGKHIYYRMPKGVDVRTIHEIDGYPGIEILGNNSSATIAGSIDGKTGSSYSLETENEIAMAPEWFITWLSSFKTVNPSTDHKEDKAQKTQEVYEEGQRHNLLKIDAAELRNLNFTGELLRSLLDSINSTRCIPQLPHNEVADLADHFSNIAPGGGKRSQKDVLIELALASSKSLWHSSNGAAYTTVVKGDHMENWRIGGGSYKSWLASLYFQNKGRGVTGSSISDAVATLKGLAVHDSDDCNDVHVRVAREGDSIYLDLGRSDWKAVEIDATGWRIVDDYPVKFVHPQGMLPLPIPDNAGDLRELEGFINTKEADDIWTLIVSWLIGTFNSDHPIPVLVVTGEQGSAKSTMCELLRRIIDPNAAMLRSQITDSRDLAITARNSWVVALDNVSSVSWGFSDNLCRLSTGLAFATRRLYTDDEEEMFTALRPIILNGIGDIISRPDLIDRSIIVSLPRIPEEKRLTTEDLFQQFDEALPRILGGLLSCVSTALRNISTVDIEKAPRMADFARFVTAAEKSLEWSSGKFMAAYSKNRESANELAIESSPLAQAIQYLSLPFEGNITELMSQVEVDAPGQLVGQNLYPKNIKAMSQNLERLAPNLLSIGIVVERKRTPGKRLVILRRVNEQLDIGQGIGMN
jgi:hypothetical protein